MLQNYIWFWYVLPLAHREIDKERKEKQLSIVTNLYEDVTLCTSYLKA